MWLFCSLCCLMVQRLMARKWRNSLCPHVLQTCRMPEVESSTLRPQSPEVASSRTVRLHRNRPRSHPLKHVRDPHAITSFCCALRSILCDFQGVEEIWRTQRAASVLPATLVPTPTTCCACGWSGCSPPSWSRSECCPWLWRDPPPVCLTGWSCRSKAARALWSPGRSRGISAVVATERPWTLHPGMSPKVGTFFTQYFCTQVFWRSSTLVYLKLISFEFL